MPLIRPVYGGRLVILLADFCGTLYALRSDVSAKYRSLNFHTKQRIPQRFICRDIALQILPSFCGST